MSLYLKTICKLDFWQQFQTVQDDWREIIANSKLIGLLGGKSFQKEIHENPFTFQAKRVLFNEGCACNFNVCFNEGGASKNWMQHLERTESARPSLSLSPGSIYIPSGREVTLWLLVKFTVSWYTALSLYCWDLRQIVWTLSFSSLPCKMEIPRSPALVTMDIK